MLLLVAMWRSWINETDMHQLRLCLGIRWADAAGNMSIMCAKGQDTGAVGKGVRCMKIYIVFTGELEHGYDAMAYLQQANQETRWVRDGPSAIFANRSKAEAFLAQLKTVTWSITWSKEKFPLFTGAYMKEFEVIE